MSLGPFSRQQADHPAPRTDGLPKTRPRSQQQVLVTGPSQPRGPWQWPAFQAQDSWSAWGHGMRECVCVRVCVLGQVGHGRTCVTLPARVRPLRCRHVLAPRPTERACGTPTGSSWTSAAPAAARRPQGPSRRQPLAPVASSLISSNAACSSSLK